MTGKWRLIVVIGVCCAANRAGSMRFPGDEHTVRKQQSSLKFPESVRFPSEVVMPDMQRPSGPSNLNGLDECGVSTFHPNRRKPRSRIDSGRMTDNVSKKKRHKYQDVQLQGRIVNGIESKPGAWPWQVSLQLLHPKKGFMGHLCGGMLISQKWILTAAHCISNEAFHYPYGPLWTVVAGEHDRNLEEGPEQRLLVEKVIMHDRYHQYHHDIALLKLRDPVALNQTNFVRSICLPPEDDVDVFKGVNCIATGWGQTKHGGKMDQLLHQTELSVVDNQQCRKVYGEVYNISINDYHLCAGATRTVANSSTGTCVVRKIVLEFIFK